jgi:hypothetical protein
MRFVSTMICALWLALAIACACGGAASASADDCRLLLSGSAAHLWLLPASRCATTKAPSSSRAGVPRTIASSRDGAPLASSFRGSGQHPLAPQRHLLRRLPARRVASDPPLVS